MIMLRLCGDKVVKTFHVSTERRANFALIRDREGASCNRGYCTRVKRCPLFSHWAERAAVPLKYFVVCSCMRGVK